MRSILLIALFVPLLAHSQSWAPVGAKWTYKQGSCCGPDSNLAVIEAIGDTLIDGRICTELAVEQGWFGCHVFLPYFTESNDSLFFHDPLTEQFQLLFRWDAVPGDAWFTAISSTFTLGDTLDWTVVDTGRVVINGIELRTWQVDVIARNMVYNAAIASVTERLGPFGTPFTWVFNACDGETFLQLRCYEDNDITWQNPSVPQCALSVGLEEYAQFPAPMIAPSIVAPGDLITVTTDAPWPSGSMLVVLDASGRLVSEQFLVPSITLSIDTPGAYIIRSSSPAGLVALARIIVR